MAPAISSPATMQTAVLVAPGSFETWEVPVPELTDTQVLVKVGTCAICTWEQRMYRGVDLGAYPFRGGHEVAGVVVARGPGAKCEAEVGDRVAVAAIVRCGACYFCRRGQDNLCLNDLKQPGNGQVWGPSGLSEYIAVEDYNVYRGPAERDLAELTLSEPVACVVRSVAKGGLLPGDTALVQGAGAMGLLHLLLLQRQGVQVLVAEPEATRREMAMQLGAVAACDPLECDLATFIRDQTTGHGTQAAFFTAGGPTAIDQALGTLAKGGHLVLYGSIHPKGPIEVDPNQIHYDELTVTGIFTHTKQSFQQAVSLIASRQVDVRPFISEQVLFSDLEYAFQRAMSPDTYRVVVTLG
jgi:threonine dehydrogenase-like Zn-dependent dehydrogenase